mmetsp:Transcript_20904/g.30100  ORF Transcript_20904/g.30100 Transcript_20904/m.30100 type:complete len:878 (+) Transcript_20904:77-2710(+)
MDASLISDTPWIEYHDESSGRPYYYNKDTAQTQFDMPEAYATWKNNEIDKFLSTTYWRRRKDENRNAYFYYNKQTRTSQWDVPQEQKEFEAFLLEVNEKRLTGSEDGDDAQSEGGWGETDEMQEISGFDEPGTPLSGGTPTHESPMSAEYSSDFGSSKERKEEEVEEYSTMGRDFLNTPEVRDDDTNKAVPSGQSEVDEKAELEKELSLLEEKLSARDAIMEPGVNRTINRYLTLAPEATPLMVVQKLSQGYTGYAQLTHIICSWIELASDGVAEFDADEFVAQEVAALVKRKFHKDLADRLIDEQAAVPLWLHDMMHKPTWRRLLIELFDESSNKGSALLGYCIRYLSGQGFHREIAHVIREAEYFHVFNDLFKDTICRFGQALSGAACDDRAEDLVGDLKRMCCSSEYMFIYAHALLKALEDTLLAAEEENCGKRKRVHSDVEEAEEGETTSPVISQWGKKMRRLRQELDQAVIWDTGDTSSPSAWCDPNPLTHTRSFAMRLTDITGKSAAQNIGSGYDRVIGVLDNDTISEVVVKDLYRACFGVDVDFPDDKCIVAQAEITKFIEFCNGDGAAVMELMSHPQVLRVFVRSLFHTSKSHRLMYSKRRVCDLLALVCKYKGQNGGSIGEHEVFTREVSKLSGSLTQAVDMCLEMSGLGSGLTSSEKFDDMFVLLKEPIISAAVLFWIRCSVTDIQFIHKSQQSAVYSVILQILVHTIDHYPLQRQECFNILKTAYRSVSEFVSDLDDGHKDSGIEIDIMDIIVYLIGTGFVREPMDFIASYVTDDNMHKFDTALIRHVFVKLLTSISPPFSKEFSTKLIDIFLLRSSRKAVESQHFPIVGVKALYNFRSSIGADTLEGVKLKAFNALVDSVGTHYR